MFIYFLIRSQVMICNPSLVTFYHGYPGYMHEHPTQVMLHFCSNAWNDAIFCFGRLLRFLFEVDAQSWLILDLKIGPFTYILQYVGVCFVHFLWYMNHPCLYLKGFIESYPSFFASIPRECFFCRLYNIYQQRIECWNNNIRDSPWSSTYKKGCGYSLTNNSVNIITQVLPSDAFWGF